VPDPSDYPALAGVRPGSRAAEFGARRFGMRTMVRARSVTVTTSPTEILTQNPNRIHWLIVNRAVNFGALWFDSEFTAAGGILIGANGGDVSMDVEEDGELVAWRIFAISDTASGLWWVVEVLGV
jgi:hypothetical protein